MHVFFLLNATFDTHRGHDMSVHLIFLALFYVIKLLETNLPTFWYMLWSRFGNLQNSWWWYWWCWWWGWGIDEKLSRRLLLRISESFRLQKSVWRNVFWFVKAYIFWKFIQCTILCDKKTTAKKKFARQNKRSKKCTAFSFASSSS